MMKRWTGWASILAFILLSTTTAMAGAPHGGVPEQITALEAAISTLRSQLDEALTTIAGQQANITVLQSQLGQAQTIINTLQSQMNVILPLTQNLVTINSQIEDLKAQIGSVKGIAENTVLALDGKLKLATLNGVPTAVFTDINVQIVNGTGATYNPNGRGNLIIGYDSPRPLGGAETCSDGTYSTRELCLSNNAIWNLDHKSGSHNLVVGDFNNYSQAGGVIFGFYNTVNGQAASVTGGTSNTASGTGTTVSGGLYNTASGEGASVTGGQGNTASGKGASVSGGLGNRAEGEAASVSGGAFNKAIGDISAVSGGFANRAEGWEATVSGGWGNVASSDFEHLP